MIIKQKNNNTISVALDSDVLRNIAFIHSLNCKGLSLRYYKNDVLKKYYHKLTTVYENILQGKIKPVIVTTIFHENKHITDCINFMKELCWFSPVDEDKLKEIDELANCYCEPYMVEGKVYSAPMQKVYSSYAGKLVPKNDAYIMAEATVENVSLLTLNGKDFVFNARNQNYYTEWFNDRTAGIVQINKQHDYFEEAKFDNKQIVPHAFHINQFVSLLERQLLLISSPNNKNLMPGNEVDFDEKS